MGAFALSQKMMRAFVALSPAPPTLTSPDRRFPSGIKRERGAGCSPNAAAAPATVSGERFVIAPLGPPGKATARRDP